MSQNESINVQSDETPKRKRATREEMIERRKAELEKLEAQARGEWIPTGEDATLSRLKKSLRARKSALNIARKTIEGRDATEKSPKLNPIAVKIANAREAVERLEQERETATERVANLPFDVEILEAAITKAENGTEDVDFPIDLSDLPEDKAAQIEAETVDSED